MDNNIVPDLKGNISKEPGYQALGKKVFWLFFLQVSPIAFVLLITSIAIFILSFQPFLINTFAGNMQKDTMLASLLIFVLSLIVFSMSFAFSWLTYTNYIFSISEDAFKIKRGIFNKTENAIPYHQIQNVNIERGFLFQMLGLSRLIILTAGQEDKDLKNNDESEGIIPAIDQKIASWLQTELLRRSNIQKVVETK